MKLSELMQKRQNDIIEDATDSLLLAEIDDWIRQAAQLEAKLEAITCGECGKNLLECDTAECDRAALESSK